MLIGRNVLRGGGERVERLLTRTVVTILYFNGAVIIMADFELMNDVVQGDTVVRRTGDRTVVVAVGYGDGGIIVSSPNNCYSSNGENNKNNNNMTFCAEKDVVTGDNTDADNYNNNKFVSVVDIGGCSSDLCENDVSIIQVTSPLPENVSIGTVTVPSRNSNIDGGDVQQDALVTVCNGDKKNKCDDEPVKEILKRSRSGSADYYCRNQSDELLTSDDGCIVVDFLDKSNNDVRITDRFFQYGRQHLWWINGCHFFVLSTH